MRRREVEPGLCFILWLLTLRLLQRLPKPKVHYYLMPEQEEGCFFQTDPFKSYVYLHSTVRFIVNFAEHIAFQF